MTAPSLVRPVAALVTGLSLLLAVTLLAAPAGAAPTVAAAQAAERRNTNPTGTAAGSKPNGAGNLSVSLAPTANGRIKVTWRRQSPVRRLKRFVVRVGPGRTLAGKVRNYRVSRRKQSAIVSHAFGATTASGNFSFVKVIAVKRRGGLSQSPAKWIQAPITSRCTATVANQVRVASFNVRTWTGDTKQGPLMSWTRREPNVVSEIMRSGAHAVAIQEASGQANAGYGPKGQETVLLERLNAADPDPTARWVDALTAADYKAPRGRNPGHTGTRVFYDASKFTELGAGLERVIDPAATMDSLIPWARLQATSGNQRPFVLTSNHLEVGTARRDWDIRGRQATRTVAVHRELRTRFGDPVVLAGDLNSTPNTLPYNNVHAALMGAGFYDAFASPRLVGSQYGTTSDQKFPLYRSPSRRDYILTLGGVKGSCSYTNQTYNSPSQVASDHFLQVAVLPLA